jgi:hypothetical protein
MKTSETIDKLAEALASAQGEIQGAHKDKDNPYYNSKYADLASVWDACRAPLSANGLAVVQTFSTEILEYMGEDKDGKEVSLSYAKVTLISRLVHSSGQFIDMDVTSESRDAGPQAIGSVVTFLRRYSLQALVGVAPEDDDGNAAVKQPEGNQAQRRPAQQQQRPTNGNGSSKPSQSPLFGDYTAWLNSQCPSRFKTIGDAWAATYSIAAKLGFNQSTLRQCPERQVFQDIETRIKEDVPVDGIPF